METLEANIVVSLFEETNFSQFEVSSLRQELNLRIRLQNTLLIISVVGFLILAGAASIVPVAAWSLSTVSNVAIFAAVLQWCHHGVRTAQIKKYLLQIDGNENGWERWLPANRPDSVLGSRWMISTKGVFLGLGLAIVILAVMISERFETVFAAASVGSWMASAWFLFTNPKE